jgi:hypothetical protein
MTTEPRAHHHAHTSLNAAPLKHYPSLNHQDYKQILILHEPNYARSSVCLITHPKRRLKATSSTKSPRATQNLLLQTIPCITRMGGPSKRQQLTTRAKGRSFQIVSRYQAQQVLNFKADCNPRNARSGVEGRPQGTCSGDEQINIALNQVTGTVGARVTG